MPIPAPKRTPSTRNSSDQRPNVQRSSGNSGDGTVNPSTNNAPVFSSGALPSASFSGSGLPAQRITTTPSRGGDGLTQSAISTSSLQRSNSISGIALMNTGNLGSSLPTAGGTSTIPTAKPTPSRLARQPSGLRLPVPGSATSTAKTGGTLVNPTKSFGLGFGGKGGIPTSRQAESKGRSMTPEKKDSFSERDDKDAEKVSLGSSTAGSYTSENTIGNSFGSGFAEVSRSATSISPPVEKVDRSMEESMDPTAEETEVDEPEADEQEDELELPGEDQEEIEMDGTGVELGPEIEAEAEPVSEVEDEDESAVETEQGQEQQQVPPMEISRNVTEGNPGRETMTIGSTDLNGINASPKTTVISAFEGKSSEGRVRFKDRARQEDRAKMRPPPLPTGKCASGRRGSVVTASKDSTTAQTRRRGNTVTGKVAGSTTTATKRTTTAPTATTTRTSMVDKKPATSAIAPVSRTASNAKPAIALSHKRSECIREKASSAIKEKDLARQSPNQDGEQSSSGAGDEVKRSVTHSKSIKSKPSSAAMNSSTEKDRKSKQTEKHSPSPATLSKPKAGKETDNEEKEPSSKPSRRPTVRAAHRRAPSESKIQKDYIDKEKMEKKDTKPPFSTLQKDFISTTSSTAPPPPSINNTQALAVDASTLQKQTHLLQLILLHDTAIESFQKFHESGHGKLQARWQHVVSLYEGARKQACELERKKELAILASFFDFEKRVDSIPGMITAGLGNRRSSTDATISSSSRNRRKTLTGNVASPVEEKIQSFSEGCKKLDALARSTEIKKIRNMWESSVVNKGGAVLPPFQIQQVKDDTATTNIPVSTGSDLPLPHPSHLNPPLPQFNQMVASFMRKLDGALKGIHVFRTYIMQQAAAPASEEVQGVKESRLWKVVEGYYALGMGLKAELEEMGKVSDLVVQDTRERARAVIRRLVVEENTEGHEKIENEGLGMKWRS